MCEIFSELNQGFRRYGVDTNSEYVTLTSCYDLVLCSRASETLIELVFSLRLTIIWASTRENQSSGVGE